MPLIVEVTTSLTERGDKAFFTLHEDYKVKAMGYCITVMKGFQTDFASVPRIPLIYASFGNLAKSHGPAVVHDALLRYTLTNQETADKIFYELLKRNGLGKFKAWLMYRAVRAFGGLPDEHIPPKARLAKCDPLP